MPQGGLTPAVTVIVTAVRTLKMHGGVGKDDLKKENVEALKRALPISAVVAAELSPQNREGHESLCPSWLCGESRVQRLSL
jgi:Formate--tetrahydrofolate ligase